jgi:phosphoribosylaminoimidazole carboxylase (NCAIR synthetase)
LLEAARARGLWLGVVDRDPAAPGFRFADRRCILSTEDEPAIERLVPALEIDGIVSPGTDWPVGVAARIAERAGLPHPITPATAVLATNKLRQRERLAEAAVPQPRWWVVGNGDLPPALDGPAVVKAPDRQGQKGLSLVERPEGLPAAIERARSAARSGAALVEELVDGPEVTVIGFSAGGAFTAPRCARLYAHTLLPPPPPLSSPPPPSPPLCRILLPVPCRERRPTTPSTRSSWSAQEAPESLP